METSTELVLNKQLNCDASPRPGPSPVPVESPYSPFFHSHTHLMATGKLNVLLLEIAFR